MIHQRLKKVMKMAPGILIARVKKPTSHIADVVRVTRPIRTIPTCFLMQEMPRHMIPWVRVAVDQKRSPAL
jgi:hypothetical protein